MKVRRLFVLAVASATLAVSVPLALTAAPAGAAPTPLPSFTKVTTALRHSCAVSTAGAVWCWGTNSSSVLGDPDLATGSTRAAPAPVVVAGSALEGKVVTDVDAGAHTTCAVTSVGGVACWGGARSSGIGNGTASATPTPTSPDFSSTALAGKAIAKVEVAGSAACAISTDGALACWGDRCGTNTTDTRPRDVDVSGTVLAGKAIRDVDTTGDHTCAVTTDGLLACWGYKQFNRLGPHATADALKPIPVDLAGSALDGKTIIDVGTGANRSCALASDGTVSCWGVGSSAFDDRPTAGTPLEGQTITGIEHDTGATCARTSAGGFACFGNNPSGRLGVPGGNSSTWVSIVSSGTAMQGKVTADLAVGTETTCAATTAGGVACWGANEYGEGGNLTCHDHLACAADYGILTAPVVLRVVPGPRSLTVTWSPPPSDDPPVTGYRISVGAVFFLKVTDVAPTARTATITGLANGTTYNVVVTATTGGAYGPSNPAVKGTPIARPTTVAPFADWTAFTNRQFADLEARQPTSAELTTWGSALSGDPTKKGTLVEGIRRGTDNTTAVDPGVRLYRAFLGRIPDANGLRFWVNRRRTGSWPLVRIADSFATSSEFKRKYGALTNEQFVTRIYTDVLGRDADPTGVDYWTRQLDLKRRTRGSVMVGFSESTEYKAKQAEGTDVVVAYVYLLGRAPTAAEEATWIALRKNNANSHAQLVRELLDSQEYAERIAG